MGIYYNISALEQLNLNLIVKNNKFKGLHFIESDICFLELTDKIFLKFSEQDIFFQNKDKAFMIYPDDNLVLKALKNLDILPNGIKSFQKFIWIKKFRLVLV